MKDYRIRILQPAVPHYRVGLFTGVGRRYPGQVEILSQERQGNIESIRVEGVACDYSHSAIQFGPFEWQRKLSIRGLRPHRDVLVVCGNPKNLSMMWCALRAKLAGVSTIWWGHHKTAGAKNWRVAIRIWMMKRLARTVLFYTKQGVRWYKELGNDITHVHATENALDLKPMSDAASSWSEARLSEFVCEKGLSGKKVILTCSRLVPKLRLDLAIQALADRVLEDERIVLAVIGEGPERMACESLAMKLGVSSRILWLGAMFNQEEMAPWFLLSKAFIYPGAIGLGILHAFSYGLPVITHDNSNDQMPEFEAMIGGKTGLLFAEGDSKDLALKVRGLLDDEVQQRAMSEFSKKHVFANYTIEKMVDNFCAAIEDAAANI